MESIEAVMVGGVVRLDVEPLEKLSEGREMLHGVLVKGKQMLAHEISPVCIGEERLVTLLLNRGAVRHRPCR